MKYYICQIKWNISFSTYKPEATNKGNLLGSSETCSIPGMPRLSVGLWKRLIKGLRQTQEFLKWAVSQQCSSFCVVLPFTRPVSLYIQFNDNSEITLNQH